MTVGDYVRVVFYDHMKYHDRTDQEYVDQLKPGIATVYGVLCRISDVAYFVASVEWEFTTDQPRHELEDVWTILKSTVISSQVLVPKKKGKG